MAKSSSLPGFVLFVILLAAVIAGHNYGYLGFDLTTFLVFILVIGVLIYKDRGKTKLQGVVIMRRTKKGRDFIDKTANKHKTLWKHWGTAGVVVAIVTLVLGSVFLINQAYTITQGQQEGGVKLLLPGPVSTPTSLPGTFVVPWWIWVIGVAFVIIPHEFMHGIMCRLDKIRIKSVGWILLIVIPGAFVEPDEKQLQRAKRSTRMKVYAAGSFANIITGFIAILLVLGYFAVMFTPSGVFTQPIPGGPAEAAGVNGTILSIDGYTINSQDDLRSVLERYSPGDTVTVTTAGGDLVVPSLQPTVDFFIPKPAIVTDDNLNTYTLTLGTNPQTGGAYMGVSPILKSYDFRGSDTDFALYQAIGMLLLWIFVFSVGVGIVNILPIKPLDGGLLFEEIVGHFTPRTKHAVRLVGTVMLLILLFNLVGPALI